MHASTGRDAGGVVTGWSGSVCRVRDETDDSLSPAVLVTEGSSVSLSSGAVSPSSPAQICQHAGLLRNARFGYIPGLATRPDLTLRAPSRSPLSAGSSSLVLSSPGSVGRLSDVYCGSWGRQLLADVAPVDQDVAHGDGQGDAVGGGEVVPDILVRHVT